VAVPPPPDAPSPTAARLIAILAPHTPFAEAIVRRQAERAGRSLADLGEGDLPKIGVLLVSAAAVFVDPRTLEKLKRAVGL
jgi:hypothetical protein